MRPIVTHAVLAVFLLALTACSADHETPNLDERDASASAEWEDISKKAGILPRPTGAKRDALIAALRSIKPSLVKDEEGALDNARYQCFAMDSSNTQHGQDWAAARRWNYSDDQPVDEHLGKRINQVLRKHLCPKNQAGEQ